MDRKPPEASIYRWGKNLESRIYPSDRNDSEIMRASRFSGWEKIDELGLPGYKRTVLPLADFLKNPNAALPQDKKQDWFVLLEPRKETGLRYRKTLLKAGQIRGFVDDTVRANTLNPEDYDLAIAETYPQEYGGNLIISKDNDILMEISRGGQGVVAAGTHDDKKHGPLLRMTRNPLTGSMKYSWEDGEATHNLPLRTLAYETLMKIPHEGEGRDRTFQEGYYEFHLIKKDDAHSLEPIFVDARTESSLASLPQHEKLT